MTASFRNYQDIMPTWNSLQATLHRDNIVQKHRFLMVQVDFKLKSIDECLGWSSNTPHKGYFLQPGFDKTCTASISRYIQSVDNMVPVKGKSTNFGEQIRRNLPCLNVGYAVFSLKVVFENIWRQRKIL